MVLSTAFAKEKLVSDSLGFIIYRKSSNIIFLSFLLAIIISLTNSEFIIVI